MFIEDRPQSLDQTLKNIWALCEGSSLSVDRFLEMRRKDNELDEAKYQQMFHKIEGKT
jgi:hypothetical protein